MGHYRSEMGYEGRDAEEARNRARRLAATTREIQSAIDERGVAAVLAEIIIEAGESSIFIGTKFKRWD